MSAQPKLALVPMVAASSPEDDLRALFRREAMLAGDLAEVRAGIGAARLRWMAAHRTYGVRVETLRAALL